MKILFISKYYWPHVGGVENHVDNISLQLTSKKHEVTILTENFNYKLKKSEYHNNILIRRISYPKRKYLGIIVIWLWVIRNSHWILSHDIVHVHDIFLWILPFKILNLNKHVYITFHGWEGIYPIPLKHKIFKKLASILCEKSISVGRYIPKYYHLKSNKITYGGVNEMTKNHSVRFIKKIVYVGRLEEDTGIMTLLKAYQLLKGYKIVFCGDGFLKSECLKYGKVLGFVNPKSHIKSASIVFASGYLSIIESFIYKKIVVTAYENELKKDYYFLTPFSKWIITSDDPLEIISKIDRITRDTEYRNKIINISYLWSRNQTWDKLTNLYLKLWKADISSH